MQPITLKAEVTADHRLIVEIPEDIPAGQVELTIVPLTSNDGAARLREFDQLMEEINRSNHPRYSPDEIGRRIAEERASWGDS